MTVTRGESWGLVGRAPDGLQLAENDALAGERLVRARRNGETPPPIGLVGGDLMRSVGGAGDRERLSGDRCAVLPVDALRLDALAADGSVEPDGTTWALAHAVLRRSWWRGEIVALMNATFIGAWDVAPRGHPNDGRVDVVRVDPDMPLRARLQAWQRLPLGTHVPHPSISIRQTGRVELSFDHPMPVRVDGSAWRSVRALRCTVEADATIVVV